MIDFLLTGLSFVLVGLQLRSSAGALLDHPGLAEAAASLGVHRNTVAYRLRRIEELTGWSLADPDLRFPLALALRLVQDE